MDSRHGAHVWCCHDKLYPLYFLTICFTSCTLITWLKKAVHGIHVCFTPGSSRLVVLQLCNSLSVRCTHTTRPATPHAAHHSHSRRAAPSSVQCAAAGKTQTEIHPQIRKEFRKERHCADDGLEHAA